MGHELEGGRRDGMPVVRGGKEDAGELQEDELKLSKLFYARFGERMK